MMLFLLGLSACLVNHELYEERRLALTDADQDGFPAEVDCHDDDPTVHPDAAEVCNGQDDDCDGDVDEAAVDAVLLYRDADGDGFGDLAETMEDCPRTGWVEAAGDCDDAASDVHPDADEVPYDGIDNDCVDGDAADLDGDGHDAVAAGGGDCDDGDATVHPGAAETWDNGATDNDCDGDHGAATLEYGASAWTGEAAGDNAGRRVTALGDVSGDGLAEFVVAAPFHGSAHDGGGAVYVVSGGEPGPLADEGVIDAGGGSWFLGSALAGGEDLDDDGVADLLVTATGWGDGRGAAWFISGADLPAEGERVILDDIASWEVQGAQDGGYLGSSVAMLGDVDGDGVGDVGVGVPFADGAGFEEAGEVYIFSPGHEAPDGLASAQRVLRGSFDGQLLGGALFEAGDQNDDGYDDFVVGSSGVIATVHAGGSSDLAVLSELAATEETGRAEPLMIGDVDGDGKHDLLVLLDSRDHLFFTNLSGNPTRVVTEPDFVVSGERDQITAYDALSLGDLDEDGREETLLASREYEGRERPVAVTVFGADVTRDGEVGFLDFGLRASCTRLDSAYGYRMALSDDVDGDGRRDILMATGGDDEAGEESGGVIAIPLPQ